jgi:hypothetical protein
MAESTQVTVSIRSCFIEGSQVSVLSRNDSHPLVACGERCLDDAFAVASVAFIYSMVRAYSRSLKDTTMKDRPLSGGYTVMGFERNRWRPRKGR